MSSHIDDLAFQTWVLTQAGSQLRQCSILHINPDFVRRGPIDPKQFFIRQDPKEPVFERTRSIDDQLSMPMISLAEHASAPTTTGLSQFLTSPCPTGSQKMKTRPSRALAASSQPTRRCRLRGSGRARPVLLVVDDQISARLWLRILLEQEGGVRVVEAGTSGQALRLARRRQFDLVISDVVRPGVNGLTFLRAFKQAHPSIPVMTVSGALSPARRQRAYRWGASACCVKPTRANRLLKAVAGLEMAVRKRAAAMKRLSGVGSPCPCRINGTNAFSAPPPTSGGHLCRA